jgi:hypothetical protein
MKPFVPMKPFLVVLAISSTPAFADRGLDEYEAQLLSEQQFLREYALGVYRHRIPGGRLYGWKINDALTIGRFKGESDEFGFSYELNGSDRLEVTTEGVKWRRAIGGGARR